MDTVEGNKKSSKVLLTIILEKTNFMLIRLLDKKNVKNVNYSYDEIKGKLCNLYYKIFRIILTDNGSELFDPLHLEYDFDTGTRKMKTSFHKNL